MVPELGGVPEEYAYGPAREPVLQGAVAMERACADHGVPLAAAALQYSLRQPRITSTVVGMSRPDGWSR